jgi:hypothetical protein
VFAQLAREIWRRRVQEYEENGRSAGASTLNGKRVGQLLLIVSVRDHERQVNSKKKEGKRESALIDILQPLRRRVCLPFKA